MELILDPIYGEGYGVHDQFTMEVSQSDSVLQIMQKIQDLKGVPISRQTLLFNDIILDDFNIRCFQIHHGSTIQLYISTRFPPIQFVSPPANDVPESPSSSRSVLAPTQPDDPDSSSSSLSVLARSLSNQTPTWTHAAAGNQPTTTIPQEYRGEFHNGARNIQPLSTIHQQSPVHGVDRHGGSASSSNRVMEDIAEGGRTGYDIDMTQTVLRPFASQPAANLGLQSCPSIFPSSSPSILATNYNQAPTQTQTTAHGNQPTTTIPQQYYRGEFHTGARNIQPPTTIHQMSPVHGVDRHGGSASSSDIGKGVMEDIPEVRGIGNHQLMIAYEMTQTAAWFQLYTNILRRWASQPAANVRDFPSSNQTAIRTQAAAGDQPTHQYRGEFLSGPRNIQPPTTIHQQSDPVQGEERHGGSASKLGKRVMPAEGSRERNVRPTRRGLLIVVASYQLHVYNVAVRPEVQASGLREMLQRFQCILPAGSYYFFNTNSGMILNENQSFQSNRVSDGDHFEIRSSDH